MRAGQEAPEGVKEENQRPLLPSCGQPPQSPPWARQPHPGWRTIAADSRLSPEGGYFKASRAPPGWTTEQWPEGFVSGTQDTTRGRGWLPLFFCI